MDFGRMCEVWVGGPALREVGTAGVKDVDGDGTMLINSELHEYVFSEGLAEFEDTSLPLHCALEFAGSSPQPIQPIPKKHLGNNQVFSCPPGNYVHILYQDGGTYLFGTKCLAL
jgi:hypothetical protein